MPYINKKKIKELIKKAKNGDSVAKCDLGFCYYYGIELEKDHKKAVELFQQAADQGDLTAKNNLKLLSGAIEMSNKEDAYIVEDLTEELKRLEKAANQGDANALNILATWYHNGIEVEEDHKKAFELFKKAADQGHESAQYNLQILNFNK
jgi:TPR repeat protein